MDSLEQLMLVIASGGDSKSAGSSNSGAFIQMGTIGWDDDADHFFPGAIDNDGHTLVAVQLYGDRDASEPLKPTRAQGRKILCQIKDGEFRVPAKDSRCFVIIPSGMEYTPGAGVIIATVAPGNEVRRNLTSGDAFYSATGGGEASVIVKSDGSITLHTTADNTPTGRSVFLRLTKSALQFVAPWGKLIFDESGFHLKTTSGGCRMDMGGISIPLVPQAITDAISGYISLTAPTIRAKGGSVFLGSGVIYNPVMHSPVSVPPPPGAGTAYTSSLQSQSVWAAP